MANVFFGSPINSSGGAVEGVDYKLIPDGNQHSTKVYNFDNEDLCKRTGVVELVPKRKGSRNMNRFEISYVYDKENDIKIGIPDGLNADKTLKFRRIVVKEDRVFKLDDFNDAMEWAVLKNCVYIEGSPRANFKLVKYKVLDHETEAEKYQAEKRVKRKAETISDGLVGVALREMGLNLGLLVDEMSPTVLSAKVCQIAEQDPKKFMSIYDSPTRRQITVFNRAKAAGVITHDYQTGYSYGSIPLGTTEDAVAHYLKEEERYCQMIDMLTKKKEEESVKSMKHNSVKSKAPEIQDEKDVEAARLKAELAEAKLLIERMRDAGLSQAADENLPRVDEILPAHEPEQSELDLLKIEAQEIGIHPTHVYKDIEKLRQKIKEHLALKV